MGGGGGWAGESQVERQGQERVTGGSWEAGVTGWDGGVGGHEVRNQSAELEVTDVAPKTGHAQLGDGGRGQETLG